VYFNSINLCPQYNSPGSHSAGPGVVVSTGGGVGGITHNLPGTVMFMSAKPSLQTQVYPIRKFLQSAFSEQSCVVADAHSSTSGWQSKPAVASNGDKSMNPGLHMQL